MYAMSDLELMKIHERSIGRAEGVFLAAHKMYISLMEQGVPVDIIRRTVSNLGVTEEAMRVIEEYSRKVKGSVQSNTVSRITLE